MSTTTLGNLLQWTPPTKIFFLMSSLSLPSFSFRPLSLVISLQALIKKVSLFLVSTERSSQKGLSRAFSSPCWTVPTNSVYLHTRGSNPLIIFMALIWVCFNRSIFFFKYFFFIFLNNYPVFEGQKPHTFPAGIIKSSKNNSIRVD